MNVVVPMALRSSLNCAELSIVSLQSSTCQGDRIDQELDGACAFARARFAPVNCATALLIAT